MTEYNGQWESEEFDNGRNKVPAGQAPPRRETTPPRAPAGTIPPAMYNPAPVGADGGRATGIVSLLLRVAIILFTLIGFAVMGSNTDAIQTFGSYAFLLSMDVIVCFYAIVQLVLSIVNLSGGRPILSSPTAPVSTITYACDMVLVLILISAVGAATSLSTELSCGIDDYDYAPTFCNKAAASVGMSCIAALILAFCAALNYYRLRRLAGKAV